MTTGKGVTVEPTAGAVPVDFRQRAVVAVSIGSLLPGESPRLSGADGDHVARLAELDAPLPPILVDRRSMRVIDGMHRLMAALLKGQETIDVEFFDGSTDDAFLWAVEANVTHGLPLSHADRRAAAARIVVSHPHMSDRAIARAAGLGAKAVAAIRRCSSEAVPELGARVGRDGKVRPLSSVAGRQRAAELIAERPQASLREVARLAGISPATVSDVRRRLESGEDPVGARSAAGGAPRESATVAGVPRQRTERRMRLVQRDPATVLEKLLRDPSLRHKEEGRLLLRLLRQNAIGTDEWTELTAVVPPHCGVLVANLARQYAETWREFAQELDERVQLVGDLAVAE
ncbi:helix-turn-helix domain-containing protein [Kitasatospora sp. NPDC005856]|uniref:helix-turn-helix domain-containing protein n=1 Tax=Kitasatospora sp. NPDC005856 TaxID=3154566 RepID=UPI0033E6D6F3